MSEELFDVVFFGILQAGKDKDSVMQNMAKIFKTDAAKLAPYFAGGRKVIKGKVNAEMAEKYRAALENAGLVIKLEACGGEAEQSSTPASTTTTEAAQKPVAAAPKSSNTEADTSDMSMAAVGADVLENPVAVPAQKIEDISSITMAETGANVLENPVVVAAQKIEDISSLSMAEVGSNVLDHTPEVAAQEIDDISGITMAETGEDLIKDPKPEVKANIPDTSELSLD